MAVIVPAPSNTPISLHLFDFSLTLANLVCGFAAIHYASYRRLQALGRDYADGWTLNLVAGSLASTAATVATQPFDALRARAMLDLPMPRSLQGLFAGFVPRLAKRPLQTTLIWALFEDLDKRLRTL